MKTLNELATHCHNEAKNKGWYDRPRPVTELLMLTVCEISEAVEADRKGINSPTREKFKQAKSERMLSAIHGQEDTDGDAVFAEVFKKHIKDTFEDEIADTFIKLFDLAGYMGIDLDFHIMKKLQYNRSRPHKHGKKY